MNKMNENRKIVLDTLDEQNIEYEMFEHQAVYTVDEIEDSDLWNHENGIGAKNYFYEMAAESIIPCNHSGRQAGRP